MNGHHLLRPLCFCGLFLLLGCSQQARKELSEKLKKSTEAVAQKREEFRESVESQTERIATKINPARIELQVGSEPVIEAAGCFGEWLQFSDGRSAVLQLRSYQDRQQETYPAIFARAIVPADANQIVKQDLLVHLYVQQTADGPIFYTPDDAPVEISIMKNDETFTAEFSSCQLLDSDTGQAVQASGMFVFTLLH